MLYNTWNKLMRTITQLVLVAVAVAVLFWSVLASEWALAVIALAAAYWTLDAPMPLAEAEEERSRVLAQRYR